jgi:phosphatidylserine decarboxylase
VIIVKEGYPAVIVSFVIGLILLYSTFFFDVLLISILGILCIFVSFFCLYFFRDPKIKIIGNCNLILSPCSGTILDITENESEKIIRVFLSILDVHLQRSPISGKVIKVEHKYGKFLKAMKPQAHLLNEQNIIAIKNKDGEYIIKQIAGIFARRCISWVKCGDILNMGDKIGLIKFGSQVDLHMPKKVNVKVKVGDKVVSGVTIFAILHDKVLLQ